ncbi:CopG family transcriptional regulator [Halomarina rubra]|uniref:CopG family transcriptional regulator n=1 Tax=Halomarina rubra TaxID=2071873 RepID=A0ABD6AW29_9EURY|nr:CopG family transcriptional regulator [Halomarina rubra]
MQEYTLLCEDGLARDIDRLAREYGLTQEAVLRQLVSAGLDSLDGLD